MPPRKNYRRPGPYNDIEGGFSASAEKKVPARKGKPTKRTRAYQASRAIAISLEGAIHALRNNEKKCVSEVKTRDGILMDVKTSYPPELVAAFRGLFGAGREYDFQMHYVATQTSDGGGGLLGSTTINPAVTSFGEWSALSALFDECKAMSSKIQFLTLNGSATTGGALADMVMAFDEQAITSSAPASVLAVYRLAEARTWVMDKGDAGSGRHTQSRTMTSRDWCSTATPATVSPIGGMAGRWSFGNSGLFAVSTAVATVFLTVVARFRNRA